MNAFDPQFNDAIFIKTAKGRHEMTHRSSALNSRQRSVLVVMDGTKSLGAIRKMMPMEELEEIVRYLARQRFIVWAETGNQTAGQFDF